MELRLLQQQEQILSQDMINFFEILQMGEMELQSHIRKLSMENPFVEMVKRNRYKNHIKTNSCPIIDPFNIDRYSQKNISFTLKEYLHFQLQGIRLKHEYKQIVNYIIENLDENGYLRITKDQLAYNLRVNLDVIKKCVKIVQKLDPPGVAAHNISECLLLQLKRMHIKDSTAEAIVRHGLELLANGNLRMLANKLKVSIDEIREAKELICKLNPKPGNGFMSENSADFPYIIPEIEIHSEAGEFFVSLSEEGDWGVFINSKYVKAINKCEDNIIKRKLLDQLQHAKHVSKYIEQRKNTLLACAQEIVTFQKDFFERGDKSKLRPLTRQDVANKLGVHTSTVYRAVKDKYLICKWGVFELSSLFIKKTGKSLQGQNTQALHLIRNRIKSMIDAEDKQMPISDEMLRRQMLAVGVDIPRRTIAKYRREMGIPNSYARTII